MLNEARINWLFSEKAVWLSNSPAHLIFLPCSYRISPARISHNFAKAQIGWRYLSPFSLMVYFASLMISKWYPTPCSLRSPHTGDDLRGQNHTERPAKQLQVSSRGKAPPPFCSVMSTRGLYLQWVSVPDVHGELLPAAHRTADVPVPLAVVSPARECCRFWMSQMLIWAVLQRSHHRPGGETSFIPTGDLVSMAGLGALPQWAEIHYKSRKSLCIWNPNVFHHGEGRRNNFHQVFKLSVWLFQLWFTIA